MKWSLTPVLLLCLAGLTAQPRYATHSVFTIGNICDIDDLPAYGLLLNEYMAGFEHSRTLIITGDMFCDQKSQKELLGELTSFLQSFAGKRVKIVLLPGDRDWDNSGEQGYRAQAELEKYISSLEYQHVKWAIPKGCPGPEKIQLDLTLTLIAINTQWWNHPHYKPGPESAECDIASGESAIEEIEDILENQVFGNVIIAGHYPIRSNGRYGGRYPLSSWLLPIPLVSTMHTAYHQNIGSPVDLSNERFSELREDLQEIFLDHNNLIYLSSHDHSREVLRENDNYFINSGIPVSRGYLRSDGDQMVATRQPGIEALHYEADGTVWMTGAAYTDQSFQEKYQHKLFQAPCLTPYPDVPVNSRLVPCLDGKYVLAEMQEEHPARTEAVANPDYEAGGVKKMLLGQHYRDSWTTQVEIPMLNLDTFKGGLLPLQVGGGRQTQSLKFRGEDGLEYVFRSVDKDPRKALSHDLRETVIALAVKDQTTTQQPFGAMAASSLLDSLNILHASPKLYVMPDDPKLGPFQEQFGNMLGMMEDRPTGKKELQSTFADADDIKRSVSMFRELYKDRDNTIEQEEYLRARVFDILVGDWGKHEDNWKWAGYDVPGGQVFRPVPRDRDHVFSRWDGLIPWLADREWAKPSGENFDYRIKGLRSLMWQARHLDRFLANGAGREDWLKAANEVESAIDEQAVADAMDQMPAEIREKDAAAIEAKLNSRREMLTKYADNYYHMLAKQVDVVGSVKDELFEAEYQQDGSLDVRMFKLKKGVKDKLFYERRFLREETKEVRLYGLMGEDKFEIKGTAGKSPLIRIVPGEGRDSIVDETSGGGIRKQIKIYTQDSEDMVIEGRESKLMNPPFQQAYHYQRTSFAYNTYTPLVFLFYSSENGFQAGGGVRFVNQRYGKPDFSSIHSIQLRGSTLGNARIEYGGQWRHMLGPFDGIAGLILEKRKNFNYFFGVGNETGYTEALFNAGYYTLRYSQVAGSVGLRREFLRSSAIDWEFILGNYSRESGADNIINEGVDIPGVSNLQILKTKLSLDLDFRDNSSLPTRGMRIYGSFFGAKSINTQLDHYGRFDGLVEFFTTLNPFTLGLRAGYARHFDDAPYYDLFYLGQNTYLRGYLQNRFAGDAAAYFNSDLRIQLLNKRAAIIPFKFGLSVFADAGRIYMEDETSDKVHLGYGAGIYFVPLRDRFVLKLSAGFSEEESGLIQFAFGKVF